MNATIIDVRRLWRMMASGVIACSLTCLILSSIFFKSRSETDLSHQLRQSVVSTADQLTYGNYRSFLESLMSAPHLTRIRLAPPTGSPIDVKLRSWNPIESCIHEPITQGSFQITLCRSETGLLAGIALILILTAFLLWGGYRYLLTIESNTSNRIKSSLQDFGITFSPSGNSGFTSLLNELSDASKLYQQSRALELELAGLKVKTEVSEQVAHDIRSPLLAMEILSSTFHQLSGDQRSLLGQSLQRIRDITHSLSPQLSRDPVSMASNSILHPTSSLTIAPIVKSVITEFQVRLLPYPGIHFSFHPSPESHSAHAQVNASELKRILSNTLTNALEALPDFSGEIICETLIETKNEELSFQILIRDSGCGISPELLSQLGTRGASFHKANGTGLGLYHARTTLESWNGHLTLQSTPNQGTTVRIELPLNPPLCKPNGQNLTELNLKGRTHLILLDERSQYSSALQSRIHDSIPALKIECFSSAVEFKQFYRTRFHELDDPLFLIDHHLSDQDSTGLDLIETLNLNTQSILITDSSTDSDIQVNPEIPRASKTTLKSIPIRS